jgi:hypothetical protein
MPNVWYIKFFDESADDCGTIVEFFHLEFFAENRAKELADRVKSTGGIDKSGLIWDGKYETFYYKSVSDLVDKLNEINEIFST